MHFIEFPALGWHFDINPTAFEFSLFGLQFTINWYGILIAIGFALAVIYAFRRADSFGINKDCMIDVVLVSMIGGIIGARLYYVLFSDSVGAYFSNPLSILRIWDGGLAIYGGIIAAFLTAIIMCRVRHVPTLAMFDLGSLGFLIGQAIGRWGNFCNQEAYGGNTTLPWGMTGDIIQGGTHGSVAVQADPVHPTFLYESLWCALGFLLLHILSKKGYRFKGQLFSLYLIWYGIGRFFIEGLRSDSLYLGTMRISQLLAAVAVLGGSILYFVLRARAQRTPKDLFAPAVTVPDAADEQPEETEKTGEED